MTGQAERGDDAALGRDVRSALRWALAGQLAKRGATFASGLVLARLLDPSAFGIYTIALAVTSFALAVNDLGTSTAVSRMQADEATERVPTAATVALVTSTATFVAIVVAAPAIVAAFDPSGDTVGAVGVVRLLAVAILVDGVVAAWAGAITRELAERRRTVAELWGFGVSITLNVGLALAGAGAWALAAGQVGGSIVTAALVLWWAPVAVRFAWDPRIARALARFGVPMVGAGVLNQLLLNSDYLVVSRSLGPAVTGAYFLAFNVSNWPVTLISFAMRRTAVAAFARLDNDQARLRAAFVSSVRVLVVGVAPMIVVIGAAAHDVLSVLYGPAYAIAAPALAFLAGIALLRLVLALAFELLVALGRAGEMFWVQAAWLAVVVPAMVVGAERHGLVGVGVAQAAAAAGVAGPLLVWRLRSVGVTPTQLLRPLTRPVIAAACATAAIVLMRPVLDSGPLRLGLESVLGVTVYVVVGGHAPGLVRRLPDALDRIRGAVAGSRRSR